MSLCLVNFTKSWSGNQISYDTCITSCTCLVAAVTLVRTLALSSTEITNTLDPNNATMSWRNCLVANIKSASLYWFRRLFWALCNLTGTVLTCCFPSMLSILLGIKHRELADLKCNPPLANLHEDHPEFYRHLEHQYDITCRLQHLLLLTWQLLDEDRDTAAQIQMSQMMSFLLPLSRWTTV